MQVRLVLALALALVPRHACVWANTEIVNFAASPRPANVLLQPPLASETWPELSPEHPEWFGNVSPAVLGTPLVDVCKQPQQLGGCPHELWLALALDDVRWAAHAAFTLRVSWPASMPADFHIDLYDLATFVHGPHASLAAPASSASSSSSLSSPSSPSSPSSTAQVGHPQTRRQFARIRVVSTGVRPTAGSRLDVSGKHVSFVVTLEPLLLGVLPASLLPTVGLLGGVALVAAVLVAPRVSRCLAVLADRVRAQSVAGGERKRE